MNKTHVRQSIAALLVLGFAASGCAVDANDAEPAQKVVVPSQEVFDYAPDGEVIDVPKAATPALAEKGSVTVPYGPTYTQAVTLAPNQSVSFSTSGGSVGVDPVLVLFVRHDNSTNWQTAFTTQVGTNTLAINDDTNGLHSSITYRNNRGVTLNARLMVFAYLDRIGTATLTGPGSPGTVTIAAGGFKLSAGAAGKAWTSGTTGGGDPWLFTFGETAGVGIGDGNWRDDKAAGVFDSEITGNHAKTMWYVANGWNAGTTTINN
jgi:hypothetical protein